MSEPWNSLRTGRCFQVFPNSVRVSGRGGGAVCSQHIASQSATLLSQDYVTSSFPDLTFYVISFSDVTYQLAILILRHKLLFWFDIHPNCNMQMHMMKISCAQKAVAKNKERTDWDYEAEENNHRSKKWQTCHYCNTHWDSSTKYDKFTLQKWYETCNNSVTHWGGEPPFLGNTKRLKRSEEIENLRLKSARMQKSTSIFRGDRTFSRMVLSVLEYRSIVLDGLGIAVGFSHGFCVIGAWWSKIYWLNAVAVWVFFTQVTHMFGLLHCCCLASQSYTQPPEKGILSQRSQDTGRLDYLQNPMDQMAIICHWIYAIECWYYMPLNICHYNVQWKAFNGQNDGWYAIEPLWGSSQEGLPKIGSEKHRRCIYHQFSYSFLNLKKTHRTRGHFPHEESQQTRCPSPHFHPVPVPQVISVVWWTVLRTKRRRMVDRRGTWSTFMVDFPQLC